MRGNIQGKLAKALVYGLLTGLFTLLLLSPPSFAEVRIGLAAPLSGPDAVFGIELRNGAEQAAADINATGGVRGQKLVIVAADDRGELKQALNVANRFVAEKISLVIGHFQSSLTLAASEIYANHSILDITASATNPQITERGLDLMFRTCGRDDQQSAVAATFLEARTEKRIAIVYDNTASGKKRADDLRARLAKAGIADVLYAGIDKDGDDGGLVGRIKAAAADVVYWSGDGNDAGQLVKEMRAEGVRALFVGSDSLASDEFALAGGSAVEGALMTFPTDPRHSPQAAAVMREFKARKIDLEVFTLYAYAAVEVLAQAAEAAGTFEPAAIAKAIHSGRPFKTVLGTLTYDAKGDVTTPDYQIYVWKRGYEDQLEYDETSR
ncbi:branched chain amino acid ABC transporter substrate-binding protein [Methylovirgula ligni]|uniref:Branched-chain amino acid transport system substrate-binding protein n=1 Tax=Methylovirgula ligni TaxID=569860 RepID=A0A3D9YW20_9HYPH|nr:branched-chain amino acid ABC transporter substrate-binding protein [Methylovirgula ligni]QAY95932.1 branched chain amino acid ABC transporter substrate-binding protein [Methylovirgula ligni]REF86408.1 branched-chain amino acid transport system substrate-binding protein [Methylovirgula ligni]